MLSIISRALALVLIVVIGYVIKRAGWVTTKDFTIFSKIVLGITLPCALFTSFNGFDLRVSLLYLTAIGIGVNLVKEVVGYLVNRHRSRRDQAFGVLNVGTYNIGAFSLPYLATFMGSQAVVFATLFDIGNSITAAGTGYAWAMALTRKEDQRGGPLALIRQLLNSPVFMSYMVLLVMGITKFRLPAAVITFTSTVGAANPFLAMLMIGIGLEIRLSRSKYAEAAKHLALRWGISTVAALGFWFLLPVERPVRVVLCMLMFAPIAAMTAGLTAEAGADVELSSFMTSVSILVAIVMLPALLILLGGG